MPVVVQNWYYIQEGREDEALDVRRAASRVRKDAGKRVGRILVPNRRGPELATFVWECEYPDLPARAIDSRWADASPEFAAVRDRMTPLLARFERIVFTVDPAE